MTAGAAAGIPGAQLLEIKPALDALYRSYLHQALLQVALGALGVVAVLAACLRSWRALALCWPLALAVLLTLGGFAALDAPLGILHLVGLLLVVAVGSNYALFFERLRAGVGGHGADAGGSVPDDDTLASLLLANLATVASFGLIALSDIPSLSAIGRVVAPGALLALLLSAAFVPRRRG